MSIGRVRSERGIAKKDFLCEAFKDVWAIVADVRLSHTMIDEVQDRCEYPAVCVYVILLFEACEVCWVRENILF